MNQSPQFINGSQIAPLTADQIKMLAKDLKNAGKIKNLEGQQKQEQGIRQKKPEQQEKMFEQKIQIEKQLENKVIKERDQKEKIIKEAGVKSWEILKQQTRLILQQKELNKLPQQIGQLTQLTWLNLYNNPLNHFPECILRLHNLNILSLGKTGLERLPENFGEKLPNLQELAINNNRLSRLPTSFNKLQKLQQLYMTVEPDSEFGLSQIPLPSSLKYLYIHLKKQTQQQDKKQFEAKCKSKKINLYWWNREKWEKCEPLQ